MRKGMILSVLSLVMVFLLLLSSNSATARIWRLNLGVGYGTYSPSLGKINEFIGSFNSWTKNTFGLSDFELEELESEGNIYSFGLKTELGSRWEVGLDINYWSTPGVSEHEIRQVYLNEIDQETLSVCGQFVPSITMWNLTLYRKLMKSKLSPFLGAGIGYYTTDISGDYDVQRDVWTLVDPPFGWEHTLHQTLVESLAMSSSSLGYVLAAGIDGSLGRLRIGLEARYHHVPKLKGEFEVENEGFSSLPVERSPFKIDPSGMSYGLYLMLHF